jgi:hypothetical protein
MLFDAGIQEKRFQFGAVKLKLSSKGGRSSQGIYKLVSSSRCVQCWMPLFSKHNPQVAISIKFARSGVNLHCQQRE